MSLLLTSAGLVVFYMREVSAIRLNEIKEKWMCRNILFYFALKESFYSKCEVISKNSFFVYISDKIRKTSR